MEYNSDDLVHLSDCEHVRKRPAMWMRPYPPHEYANALAVTAFTPAVFAVISGGCRHISARLEAPHSMCVEHSGLFLRDKLDRYSHVDRLKDKSETEICSTVLSHWRKLYREAIDIGFPGVAFPVLNFLSLRFEIENRTKVERNRYLFHAGELSDRQQLLVDGHIPGVLIRFTIDPEFASESQLDVIHIRNAVSSLNLDFTNVGLDLFSA